MKRIYASLCIIAAVLAAAYYSSRRVENFAGEVSLCLGAAAEAVQSDDLTAAREALSSAAELCSQTRRSMSAFLRVEDFAELEAAMRAADGYLELDAAEEAYGEIRRAEVQAANLAWLAGRYI